MNNVICVPRLTYALELRNGKFYVGITYNLNQRIAEHTQGDGAKWTRLHKPTGRILAVRVGDFEKELTLEFMRNKGWKNVRGGGWTKVDMYSAPHELALANSGQSAKVRAGGAPPS